ncbi:hypothetical protein ABW20_dc0102217 [Dactylellina cionopaga]|nr:hypothetical protein ABW20_dc0102217 [Dactylellina cionopaga]
MRAGLAGPYTDSRHYGQYAPGNTDAGEREGFMRGAWAPGGNAMDAGEMAAVVPPKYVPPEQRGNIIPPQQPERARRNSEQEAQLGELPGDNRLEGLSELSGMERRPS